MKSRRLNMPAAALVIFAAGALTGCETAKNTASSAGQGIADGIGSIGGIFVPDRIEPLVDSVAEEYCMVPNVVRAYGPGELSAAAVFLGTITEQTLNEEEKAQSLFCKQNLGGVVLVTDRVMNDALGEMQNGVQVASEALDLNVKGQQATLARIARMKNLSIGEKLDPKYAEDLEALDKEMSILADAAEKKLEALAESGGISTEAQAKLEEAHKHFVNFRHYQGKALSGIAVFDAARQTYGMPVVYQAFQEAIRIDQAQNKQKSKKFPATEKLARAFVEALPKFTETMFSGGRISSAIWEAADTADFEDALEDINEPPAETKEELVTYANDVNASAGSLGLPGVGGLGG